MKNKDVVVGMKVVPHDKTPWSEGDTREARMETSGAYRQVKQAGQEYLYVSGWDKEEKAWMLNNLPNKDGGDYFFARDFEPYAHTPATDILKEFLTGKKGLEPQGVPLDDAEEDVVNHPDHYASGGIECWDAIQASMTPEAFRGYLKGNVQKYIWRYEKKEKPLEDLQKARVYLNKLIDELIGEKAEND